MPRVFERTTCSRCGGSGHYSYNPIDGTICFKCRGKTEVLTKRGFAAQQYFTEISSIPAKYLKPGMVVKPADSTWGFGTIEQVGYGITGTRRQNKETGEMESLFEIKTSKCSFGGYSQNSMWRLALGGIEKECRLLIAGGYQATLTKQGKVKKHNR